MRLDRDLDQLARRDTPERALLLAQEVAAGVEHRRRAGSSPTSSEPVTRMPRASASPADLVEGDVHRRDRDVGQVHRDLGDAVLLDEPADALDALQRCRGSTPALPSSSRTISPVSGSPLALDAPLLAHVEGDRVGAARRGRVQVDVVGDQEVARADRGGAGARVERRPGRSRASSPGPPGVRPAPRTRPRGRRRGCARSGRRGGVLVAVDR